MAIREVAGEQERAGRPDIREQILLAAEHVLVDRGLAACTTRAIAEAAGCAEGSIYRYFADKHDLFIEMVKRRFPAYLELMRSLPELAGTGDVGTHLEDVAKASLVFYRAILPMAAGAMADHDLMLHQRKSFLETKTGPMRVVESLAEFLRGEQQAGRLCPDVSADHAARTLLGACFFQAYLEFFLGDKAAFGPDEQFAAHTVGSLMTGLQSRRSRKPAAR